METLLKIDHVSKSFGKLKALDDVSITINPGEIIGLLGPNGSGKTTLIKIINGLYRDFDGNLDFEGRGGVGIYSKSIVSYLPDTAYIADWMKGINVLELFMDMYQDFDYERCMNLLNRFGIDPKLRFKTLSKGTKDKFMLSLVMSRHAKLIVLDEPIGGVDPAARDVILDTILENYDPEQTIIMSTHLISDIERIFNRVLFIKQGKVILDDDVDAIRSRSGKSIDELFREEFRYVI